LKKEGKKMNAMIRLYKEEDGQGMTEYALIIALVVVLLIGSVVAFREKIVGFFVNPPAE
jgi:pilus assembly protein Flp/PilA